MNVYIWINDVLGNGFAAAQADSELLARKLILAGIREKTIRSFAGLPKCRIETWVKMTVDKCTKELAKPADITWFLNESPASAIWKFGNA
jgi:hypothetical protein